MLLNNLKAGEKKKKKHERKKKAVSEELSQRKENATGGEECLQSRGFSHFNFGLRD